MFTGEVRNQIDRIWDAVWSGGMSTPDEAYDAVANQVFPYIREMGGDDSTFGQHMKNARLTIPSPGLFAKVIDMLDEVPMDDLDTKGDVYKYLLSEISTSGKNGQFRTLRIPLPPMDIQARLGVNWSRVLAWRCYTNSAQFNSTLCAPLFSTGPSPASCSDALHPALLNHQRHYN